MEQESVALRGRALGLSEVWMTRWEYLLGNLAYEPAAISATIMRRGADKLMEAARQGTDDGCRALLSIYRAALYQLGKDPRLGPAAAAAAHEFDEVLGALMRPRLSEERNGYGGARQAGE